MNEAELSQLLEECVQQMRAGVSLDEVLERYPAQSADLRPLLEVAWMTVLHQSCETIPAVARNRSRAAFLAHAVQLREMPVPHPKRTSFFSLAFSTAALSLVVISALLFTGLASANTLPGDLLYPVKINLERAGQALVSDIPSRMEGVVKFDTRRAGEVKELLASGRSAPVFFGGFLDRDDSKEVTTWKVENISLTFADGFDTPLEALAGSFVELSGTTQQEGTVLVENLALRLFHLKGTIEQINGNTWKVAGLDMGISPQTQIAGSPVKGARVQITAILFPNSQWVALTAQVEGSSMSATSSTPLQIPQTNETIDPGKIETSDNGSDLDSGLLDSTESEIKDEDLNSGDEIDTGDSNEEKSKDEKSDDAETEPTDDFDSEVETD
jgi:hypothetical protein